MKTKLSVIIYATIIKLVFGMIKNEKFDYFVFSQVYPDAICQAMDDTESNVCHVPDGSVHWTIHGLWYFFFLKNV